jgi:hypothetical protein
MLDRDWWGWVKVVVLSFWVASAFFLYLPSLANGFSIVPFQWALWWFGASGVAMFAFAIITGFRIWLYRRSHKVVIDPREAMLARFLRIFSLISWVPLIGAFILVVFLIVF